MAASSSDTAGPSLYCKRRLLLLGASAAAATALTYLAFQQLRRRKKQRERRCLALRSSSRYAAAVVTEAAWRRNIVINSTAPCQWGDFSRLDWDRLLGEQGIYCRVSCLYLRASLVRKGMLAYYLTKRKQESVLPPGFVIDVEDEDDLRDLQTRLNNSNTHLVVSSSETISNQPAWIVKSSNANRGEHLYLSHSVDDVVSTLRKAALEGPEPIVEWVVQQYIHPPLLLNGRKFHLRVHLLLSGCPCCGTTRAWLHEQSIVALASSVQYHSDDSGEDRFRHLTNHCVQEAHPHYDESKQILLLDEVGMALRKPTFVSDVLGAATEALSSALVAASSAAAGFAPLPLCFELFGADFTLEDRGGAAPGIYLLEINAGPDMGIFGQRLREKCIKLVSDVLQVAVEPHIMHDTVDSSKFHSTSNTCACARAAEGTAFGKCLWNTPPRKGSIAEEMHSFKQRLRIAGNWAKSLHEDRGIEVRGPQAEIMK